MLADFGQSMISKSGIATSTFTGSPAYYSPQLLKASLESKNWDQVDCAKTDVYALGIVYLQIFNGLESEE